MALHKKRSTSPKHLPSWINDLVRDNHIFKLELQQLEASLRNIRLLALENQQLLRDLNRSVDHFVNTRSHPTPSGPHSSDQTNRSTTLAHRVVPPAHASTSIAPRVRTARSITSVGNSTQT